MKKIIFNMYVTSYDSDLLLLSVKHKFRVLSSINRNHTLSFDYHTDIIDYLENRNIIYKMEEF